MTSTIHADKIMNSSGDQDSGVDLLVNDQVKIKTANTDRVTVTDSATTVSNSLKVDTILKANGNKLDINNFVGPTFKAYKSAAQNSVTHNGGIKVTFETEVWDSDSCYNTTNSRFTPDVAGYYLITAQLEISHAIDEARVMGMLYKNGSIFAEGNNSPGNDNGVYPSSRSTWLVPLDGDDDYVEIYTYGSNAGGTYNFATDQNYRCTFEGTLIRGL